IVITVGDQVFSRFPRGSDRSVGKRKMPPDSMIVPSDDVKRLTCVISRSEAPRLQTSINSLSYAFDNINFSLKDACAYDTPFTEESNFTAEAAMLIEEGNNCIEALYSH